MGLSASIGGPKTWCVSSLGEVEPGGIFEEPVWGSLPYVASMSEALYPFHGVMMDDERVLGVTVSIYLNNRAIDLLLCYTASSIAGK